jgi:uncharacterized membrane-anchored protein YitT (DUF2179 family)
MEVKMSKLFKKIISIVIGQFISASAFNLILLPNKLVGAGLGGIATNLNNLFGFNIQVSLILMCLPILIWSILKYERVQVLYAAFNFAMFTFYIGFIDKIFPTFQTDPIVAVVTAGVMNGIAAGIIIRQSCANGPEAIVGMYLKAKKGITVGNFFMVFNTIVIFASILYGDITLIIYSLICNAISSYITDIVIIGTKKYYVVQIMSDHYLDITEFVQKELNRGVTFIQGLDTSNVKKKMLLQTVMSNQETIALKEFVQNFHDDSFVYVIPSAGLLGRGFETL